MRTWTFPEARPPGDGPWTDEPDKAQWIDEATSLDCLTVRNRHWGNLCGYVGVPPGHPWHGLAPSELPYIAVHGGVNFASYCQEDAEDGPGICHIPEPGRPERVWWLGFDCAHAMDLCPTVRARLAELDPYFTKADDDGLFRDVYRTFGYVQDEVALLAAQAHIAAQPSAIPDSSTAISTG
jgi:hypothetical protein